MAQAILFDREKPAGTPFEAVARLKTMSPEEAAGTILNHKIPFLVATGALGGIKGKTDIILALIERMSGNEVIGNTVTLEKWGVFESPILKAAYDAAVERAKKDKKVSTLKAGKAIEKAGKKATPKMKALQEEKLSQLGGIDGDWLVLGDRSGSMSLTIEMARFTASLIAQQVKGKVYLIFFNTEPQRYDVTGLTFEQIKTMTARVTATGGTAIGCGVDLIRELGIVVNGIVICSDGGDNTRPLFHEAYRKYAEQMGIEPTVYHFWVPGESNVLTRYCATGNIPAQMFDMSKDMDYYSLPNIIPTLRSNRYTLYDEIMGIPLLTISQALERTAK